MVTTLSNNDTAELPQNKHLQQQLATTLSNSDTTELHQKQNNQQQRLPLKATVTQGSCIITKEQQQQWLLLKVIAA